MAEALVPTCRKRSDTSLSGTRCCCDGMGLDARPFPTMICGHEVVKCDPCLQQSSTRFTAMMSSQLLS